MDLFASSNSLTPIPIEDGELGFLKQLDLPIGNEEILARLIDEKA